MDTTDLPPDVFAHGCPSRVVLDRIGDKWTVLAVTALAGGSMRFTELRNRLDGVTPKVLTQTLRALERDGILTRTIYAEVPPRVEYELTELGHSLRKPIEDLRRWAEDHVAEIRVHQVAYSSH